MHVEFVTKAIRTDITNPHNSQHRSSYHSHKCQLLVTSSLGPPLPTILLHGQSPVLPPLLPCPSLLLHDEWWVVTNNSCCML